MVKPMLCYENYNDEVEPQDITTLVTACAYQVQNNNEHYENTPIQIY